MACGEVFEEDIGPDGLCDGFELGRGWIFDFKDFEAREDGFWDGFVVGGEDPVDVFCVQREGEVFIGELLGGMGLQEGVQCVGWGSVARGGYGLVELVEAQERVEGLAISESVKDDARFGAFPAWVVSCDDEGFAGGGEVSVIEGQGEGFSQLASEAGFYDAWLCPQEDWREAGGATSGPAGLEPEMASHEADDFGEMGESVFEGLEVGGQ